MNQSEIKSRQRMLLAERKSIAKLSANAPKENLQINRNKFGYYFYSRYVDEEGKEHRKYIHRKEEELITRLALKRYCNLREKEIQLELDALESYEKVGQFHGRYSVEDLLLRTPVISELLQPILKPVAYRAKQWVEEGNPSTYREEEKRHSSKGGLKVRSKAEAMIASCLEERGIPFRYEDRIRLQGGSAIPDFTIMNPTTGKKIYWEHLGMMDDMAYYESAIEKLAMYQTNGIYLGNNLILTVETLQQPLTYKTIQGMVESIIEA